MFNSTIKLLAIIGVGMCLVGFFQTLGFSACTHDVCAVSSGINKIIGILASISGIVWFSLLNSSNEKLLKLLMIVGVVGIFFLITYSLVLKHYCPICFLTYFVGFVAIATALLREKTSRKNNINHLRRI